MKIKFWGVRGSIPSPLTGNSIRSKIKTILRMATPSNIQNEESIDEFIQTLPFSSASTYGSNTTCLELRDSVDNLVIIDAGTGVRELGNNLLSTDFLMGKGKANWILSHSHWDHMQGMPFFVPLYIPGNRFDFHASMPDIEKRLRYQFTPTHFPVGFDDLNAAKVFHHIPENQPYSIEGTNLIVTTKAVRHPGGNFAFKFVENGKTFIFSSDVEFSIDEMDFIESYIEFFANADVLVFDTQYTLEESLKKIDWGHSSASMATDIALKAHVKKLVMFHHDPSYDDSRLDAVYLKALNYKDMFDRNNELEIIMAYEGLVLEI